MSSRNAIILTLVMIAMGALLSLAVYPQLPERVASHWNAADQVDGTMPRFWGAFLMPLITLGMLGFFLVIPAVDPLKANIAQFRRVFNVFIVFIIGFMLYLHVLTTLWNLGVQGFRMSTALLPAMGLLFVFVGILLRQAKRNFSIGIRTRGRSRATESGTRHIAWVPCSSLFPAPSQPLAPSCLDPRPTCSFSVRCCFRP